MTNFFDTDDSKGRDMSFVHHLFEKQCEKSGDMTAIRFRDELVSYAVLNQKASNLARAIRYHFPHEPIISISSTRNTDLIVGVLAILKAGKAYLPLDPHYPTERLVRITKDAGVKASICSENERTFFEALGLKVIASDAVHSILELPELNQGFVAYTLYTSGSTGKPKGVCMGHSALVNLLCWQQKNSIARTGTNTLQFAPLSFDVSFQEIFSTLTTGGMLVMIDDDLRLDPLRLLQFISYHDIHRLFLPFVALQQMAEVSTTNNIYPGTLQEIMTAGEQLKITPQIRQFFSKVPACILYNQYGPTEAHVVTSLKLQGDASNWPWLPTIGKPIDQTQIYIVDEKLTLLPDGEIGELCITGVCVANEYLNNPVLSAEKFIIWKHPDGRQLKVYKTGDLGRYLPDGTIEFLGRMDDQVKIRGHRVELGEIEVALNQLNGVQQAVVAVREDIPGQQRLVAYLVSSGNTNDTISIRESLQKTLPDYMMPSAFVWLQDLPKTSTGKVDKKSLPKPEVKRPALSALYVAPVSEIEKRIAGLWSQVLQMDRIGTDDNFFELGGNSLLAVKSVVELKQQFNYDLPITKLYQRPTIKSIADYFNAGIIQLTEVRKTKNRKDDIAVIGMAGRFPGANSVEELWNILKEGRETIRFFRDGELHFSVSQELRNDNFYVKARGILTDVDKFDASFFGINPRVAALMDPQQRVFLEIAWEVLEQTGHLPDKYTGTIGVFAGSGNNSYYLNNVLPNKQLIDKVGAFQVMTVNEKDYIATRVAYQLNLRGPAVSVYSGCSTSLLAIAQAAESIRNGNCAIALAGGVAIHAPVNSGHYYEEGAMFSPDGHCRPFDKDAKGTVFSDGAGIVLLKSLPDAIRDNDTIYAVLKGVGYNNDGAGKASFTAPSAEGQAGAIVQAIHDAGIQSSVISYIETHGTATPLGDPIEIDGLQLAFGHQERKQFCAIGSLKSNMGHLTAAAGVAGFIKTTLALYNKQLPASLHYKEQNPNIQFASTPFFVNASHKNWESEELRRAGVSSFGVGGTNVHVILEEYRNVTSQLPTRDSRLSTPVEAPSKKRPFALINWSAKTEGSREMYAQRLHENLTNRGEINIEDLAYTLQITRTSFNARRFAVVSDHTSLRESLISFPSNSTSKQLEEKIKEIAFLFPGQGSQYPQMGLDLYTIEPVFKNAVDECALLLEKHMHEDIRQVMFYSYENSKLKDLNNTRYTQPALFTIEYALAKLWMSWGVKPSVLAGHSIGEFVAAHLAGIFSLPDVLKLVALRSRMMGEIQPGKMLSVQATEEDLQSRLPVGLSIAAVNTSKAVVVSGISDHIDQFAIRLKAEGIASRVLKTSHAFHSLMMDEIVEPFRKLVGELQLNTPSIPIASTVTGRWLTNGEATDPAYWANQLRATVRFADALDTLYEGQKKILLEVGPGDVASTLARQQLRTKSVTAVAGISRDHKTESEYYTVLESLGTLWLNGIEPDWKALYSGGQRKKIVLPTYSFDRQYCWVEPAAEMNKQKAKADTIDTIEEVPLPQMKSMKKEILVPEIMQILEDASGIESHAMSPDVHFMELGLDSLSLTQISLSLKKKYKLPITFRQLIEDYNTIYRLADFIDSNLPKQEVEQNVARGKVTESVGLASIPNPTRQNETVLSLISQQIQLLAKQVSLLQGEAEQNSQPVASQGRLDSVLSSEEEVEIKKPFGATARIQTQATTVNDVQQKFIEDFIRNYNKKTAQSKAYAQQHRSKMADPRVVSGFQPLIKEMVYPIVVNKSRGSRLWDIDGNEYIDALNGFGSNLLGYQQEDVKKAIQQQVENGYEIGPQHELAGEVCDMICQFTNFDRAALCNTGSEAVLGAIRIARTVTGRSTIVSFNGSYHGIIDEVIVRGTKKLKSFPAAPGIMHEAVHNILVLDYGTEESLQIIRQRASELAAVLVEPVQSRRPEFVPIPFLKELRKITQASGTVLIFDEVITGFRMHPGGVQSMFDIKADLGTYGKVVAGGMPIGVIAGDKKYMDALDGGAWQYGDDSIPEAGVTYFAGTFVRHPLALAAAKASLLYMKKKGPALQESISAKAKRLAKGLNQICQDYQLPLCVAQFGSLWKFKFKTEVPYGETLFSLLRYKGIHIWDLFPCFITEAHTEEDIDTIIEKFQESVDELVTANIFPSDNKRESVSVKYKIEEKPPVPGAKLGKDEMGNAGWFLADPDRPGKYLQIVFNEN